MLYIAIFILLLFLSYRYDYSGHQRGKKTWFYILLIVFICIAGFRYRLGSDTLNYIYYFKNILKPLTDIGIKDIINVRYAPGFVLSCSFFKVFTNDFTVFQVFHSAFVNIAVFIFLKRYCRHFFFALLLFFVYLYFLFLFQQIRESMAVSILLLAWPLFKDGKWIWWYLASLLAFSFHISAAVMFLLPLFTLPFIRELFVFGKRTLYVCLALLVVGFIIQSVFFNFIEAISFSDALTDRARTYDKSSLGVSRWNIGAILPHVVRYILYPTVMLIILRKNGIKVADMSMGGYKWQMMVIMCIYVSVFTLCITIVLRYTNYFFLFVIVSLSNWAFSIVPILKRNIKFRFSYWILFFLPMIAAQCQTEYFGPVNKSGTLRQYMVYYPYSSCFDQTRDINREECYNYYRLSR